MELDVVYREVIILFFYERFSIKEIGEILHIAEGTVKSRLFTARKNLKSLLHNEIEQEDRYGWL